MGNHLRVNNDTAFLTSLNTQGLFEIREDSTCLCRYCCHQQRELRLGFFAPRSQVGVDPIDAEMQGGFGGLGWPEGEVPMLTLLRPFQCTLEGIRPGSLFRKKKSFQLHQSMDLAESWSTNISFVCGNIVV